MRRLLVLTAAAMLTLGIAGCGGDDGATGATGPQGPAGTPGATGPQGPAGTSAITLNANTPAATFAALDMDVSGVSVTIASPPVVNFKITDRTTGTPIIGYGSKAKCFPRNNTTTPYEGNCYPNLAFALAKLVPGSGGSPSRWVNYIVVAPATVATNGTVNARTTLQTPSTENFGTLVDNGDGTYKYTFYNDIPGMAALVAGITAPTGSNKADLDDVSYNKDLTHRLVVVLSGSAPGTGSNNSTGLSTGFPTSVSLQKPVNFIYDFVPATGQVPAASANRKMVANANCESCHSTLGGLPGGDGASLDFHGGSRNDIEYCVICHTEQRKYGRAEATFNATTRAFSTTTYKLDGQAIGNALNFIHKIHVAGVMTRTNYDYGGVKFDQGGYSQDIRNCDKCHDSFNAATPQAGLWKTEANRKACSSCHDGINFDTGVGITLADAQAARVAGTFPPPNSTGFFGKAHPENSTDGSCLNSSCHAAGAPGDPDVVHKPVTPPNTKSALHVAGGSANTNAGWIASNTARLPAGAIKVSYEIQSVSMYVDAGGVRRPRMVFRMLQNGVRKDLNVLGAKPDNTISGQQELWDGFVGGPSLYFVWAVPQDGISKPADFNASVSSYLRCLWNGSAPVPDPDQCTSIGALTGPDASGWYIATLTDAIIPVTATMLTGGVGYSYNVTSALPLTQTNLPEYPAAKSTVAGLNLKQANVTGGLIVVTPNVQKVADGFTGRRAIVEDKRCNACHQELGTFTEDAFHGGQRNDGTTCSWCHTPNRNSSGWTADSKQFVHAIHARDKRTVPYTWHSISTTDNFSKIVYPGVLARCEQCHIPGSYDFSNSASADAAGLGSDGLNKRQFVYISGTPSATDISLSPYVVGGTPYGAGFSYAVATGVTTLPADTTLIQSPTTSACVGCHDSSLAISHMKVNGGRFYEPRTTQFAPASNAAAATAATEQCMICHSSGRQADTKAVHAR